MCNQSDFIFYAFIVFFIFNFFIYLFGGLLNRNYSFWRSLFFPQKKLFQIFFILNFAGFFLLFFTYCNLIY